jgi:ribosomal protein S25
MNLLWMRSVVLETPDERRVRDYVDSPSGVSESARSLSDKLGISRGRCQRILERLVEQGILQRREYSGMEPMYLRFPSR